MIHDQMFYSIPIGNYSPVSPTEIYKDFTFVRHGETAWNSKKVIQGQKDVPLSRIGMRQATTMANKIDGTRYPRIYSSDLIRAFDTAKYISELYGIEIVCSSLLRERNFGEFEGQEGKVVIENSLLAQHIFKHRNRRLSPMGGESLNQFQQRVFQAVLWVVSHMDNNEKDAILVTHAGVIDILYRHSLGIPLEVKRTWKIPNCSSFDFHAIIKSTEGFFHIGVSIE
jgi:2,3-bisphosphoglycerate-dependent phosphoglycerate mutase